MAHQQDEGFLLAPGPVTWVAGTEEEDLEEAGSGGEQKVQFIDV